MDNLFILVIKKLILILLALIIQRSSHYIIFLHFP